MTTSKQKIMELKVQLHSKLDAFLLDFKPAENCINENEESLSQLKERLSEQLEKLEN